MYIYIYACYISIYIYNVYIIIYLYSGYLRIAIVPKRGEPPNIAIASIALKPDYVVAFVGCIKKKKTSHRVNGKKLEEQVEDEEDANFA